MNYLVTHYKNLAEQLQARINHIQQCLYEMDAAAGGGIDQVRADTSTNKNMIQPVSSVSNQIPSGDNIAPWDRGTPVPNRIYIWGGDKFKYNNGTWYVFINGTWINAFEYGFK